MFIKNILVPIDFSPYSEYAVNHALLLAKRNNAHITLLHALVMYQENINEEVHFHEYENLVKKMEKESYRLLKFHKEKTKSKEIPITSEVTRGFSAANSILDNIHNSDFDVVIMGTHGRTGIKKLIYGSVAEKIVRLSPIPVLTTMEPLKKFGIEKILVPIDFSTYSERAAKTAISLAQEYGSQLVFMHVIDQNIHPSFYSTGVTNIFEIDSELPKRSKKKLREFAGISHDNATYVIEQGQAHYEIVKYARDHDIDLIIMSTRGLNGLDHVLLGSTTERVVRLSNCPVLTLEREDRR